MAEAEDELARGLELAAPLERNRFLVGVLHATRADIRLLAARPRRGLAGRRGGPGRADRAR